MRVHIVWALLVISLAYSASSLTEASELLSEKAACTALKKTISKQASHPESGPVGMGWFCDTSTQSNEQWFVIALRSNRECEGISSNLMGWYAVDRRSGAIHDYNAADMEVGAPLK